MAKQAASPEKTSTHSAEPRVHSDNTAGPAGVAVAPPSYGLDVVDQAMPEEVAEYEAPEGVLQRQAVGFSAGGASPEGPPEEEELPFPLQAKLKIGPVNDPYEREADRVAERVMRMPAPSLQRQACACGKPTGSDGMCADCQRKQLGIQRMASGSTPQTTAPPIVHQVLSQPGQPLDRPTRNFMGSRFGQDFSQVNVHTDNQAAQSARTVNARAYTVGNDMVFGAGQFAPETNGGKRLLAHELTHTVQQNRSSFSGTDVFIQRQADQHRASIQGSVFSFSRRRNGDIAMGGIVHAGESREAFRRRATRAYFTHYFPRWGEQIIAEMIRQIRFATVRRGPFGEGHTAVTIVDRQGHISVAQRYAADTGISLASILAEQEFGPEIEAFEPAMESLEEQLESTLESLYASGRDLGQVELGNQSSALPATIQGPQVQPVGGIGDYSIHLTAPDTLTQVSLEFDTIRYRWELWNISNTPGVQELEAQYGLLNLPDSPELQAQVARVREGQVSEGVEGGQTIGRGPAGVRRLEQTTEDLGERPQQIEADRAEAVSAGRYWDVLANEINSGLIGLEVVARYGSALLDVAADNFHNGDERQIPWREQGVYVIRCTAVVNPEAEEREPTYAPSVATKIVVVAPLEQVSQEAIDAPLDEASQLDVRLALLRRLPEGHPDRSMIRQLEERLETSDILATGTTIDVIERNLALKRQDLAALRGTRLAQIREEHGLSDTAITQLEWEIETLEDQLAQARTRAGEIHSHTRASARRVHGTLVSRETGEIYPLLLQISEPYLEGGNWRCQLSDVTDPHGSIYDGVAPNSHGDVERAKFRAVTEALEDFAGGAGYVEGSLTVRLPEGGWFASLSAAQRNQTLESRPRNEAAAIRRMEELGTAIALLGLVVSSPVLGAVGAGLGAALAAQRFAQRMADGTFSASDPQNIIDLIDILSAAAVGFGAGVRALGPITVVAEGEGFALQLTRGAQRLAEAAETAETTLDVIGVIHCNAEATVNLIGLSGQTGAAARRERARIIAGVIQSNGIFAHQLGGVQGDSRHQATPPIHPDTAGHTPHSEGPEASSRAATRDAGSEEPAHPPRTAEPEAEPPRTARGEAEPRRRQGESRPDALRAGTPPSVDMEVGPGRITATVEGCMFCVNPCGRLANFIERGLLRVIGLRRSTRRALRRIGRRATRIDESLSQRYVTRDYAEEKARELASEIDELARENGGDDALRDSLGEGNTQQLIEAIESAVRVPIVTEADVGSRLEPTSEPVPHTSATGEIAARDRRVDEAIAAYRQRPRARPNVPGDGIVAAGVLDLDGDQNRHLSENLFTGASPWALAQGDTHDATFVPRRSDTGTPVTNPQAINHAEQTVLGRAARALQTAFGDQATSITGQLRMSIERRSPCVNCMSGVQGQGVTNVGWRGPIVQFSERFPGIRLVITFPDPSAESGARTFTIRAGILDG